MGSTDGHASPRAGHHVNANNGGEPGPAVSRSSEIGRRSEMHSVRDRSLATASTTLRVQQSRVRRCRDVMSATSEDVRVDAIQRGADDDAVAPALARDRTTSVLDARRLGTRNGDQRLRAGALRIDLETREAHVDDRRLALTAREFELLAYLVARPGHVFSRDQLLRAVWHSTEHWQQSATVTEHIRRLRMKVEIEPRRPRILVTVRGAGYRLEIPEDHCHDRKGEGTLAADTVVHIDGGGASDERLAENVRMANVGRLAGGIAHDFNNFLAVIGGHIDLARSAPGLSADVAPHLDQIDDATKRATELIRQLLAFGRHDPEPVMISISEELDSLASLLGPTFRSSIAIDVVSATTDDLVKFDRSRLDQIFVNLAFNARDAMPHGGSFSYAVADDTLDPKSAAALGIEPGSYVVVTVTDDGTGIDPTIIDHVFERHVTTKPPGEGNGLGLSTVLGVITQAGGAITVDRDRASGTEFTLYFRRATCEHAA